MAYSLALQVDGSEILKGLSTQIDKNILVTKGHKADATNFKSKPRCALLISCVGRKLMLSPPIDE